MGLQLFLKLPPNLRGCGRADINLTRAYEKRGMKMARGSGSIGDACSWLFRGAENLVLPKPVMKKLPSTYDKHVLLSCTRHRILVNEILTGDPIDFAGR